MKKYSLSMILFFLLSCSTNSQRPGAVVLNYRQAASEVGCKEKMDEKNIELLIAYYGAVSKDTIEKVFSILNCDTSKVYRFLKATKYISDIAEYSEKGSSKDYIRFFIPKVCLQKIDYEEEAKLLVPVFEKGFSDEEAHELYSCTNHKYQSILKLIDKSTLTMRGNLIDKNYQ